ncbi:MAG: DUF805 domain-containing protein [Paramuribaculum sp.]|nr:DUF805 domain-containing protein [Paramuribaculum sp.]
MKQYQVSFGQAISSAFKSYCVFYGRASRSEYWWFQLLCVIVSWIILLLGYYVIGFDTTGYKVVSNLWNLAIFLPSLGLMFRRLHDTGRSGWNWLWAFLPIIGWVILIVYLCKESQMFENKYGPVPNAVE